MSGCESAAVPEQMFVTWKTRNLALFLLNELETLIRKTSAANIDEFLCPQSTRGGMTGPGVCLCQS